MDSDPQTQNAASDPAPPSDPVSTSTAAGTAVAVEGPDITETGAETAEWSAENAASDPAPPSDPVSTSAAAMTEVAEVTGCHGVCVCEHDSCGNEVFLACPTCLHFLCYDHMDSACKFHSKPPTQIANHDNIEKYVTIVDGRTGEEFQVAIEASLDDNHDSGHASKRVLRNYVTIVDGQTGDEFRVPIEDSLDDTINTEDAVEHDLGLAHNDKSLHSEQDETTGNHDSGHATKRVRRKTSHPQMWGRNVAKNNHLKGRSYQKAGSESVPARSVQQCNCTKCRYKCTENFPDNVRTKIFTEFYELGDFARQKDYIVNHVIEMPSKTMSKTAQKHREVARAFYLSYEGIRKRVCGNFFCKTLDLKIRSIQKYFSVHRGSLGIASVPDGRGRHSPPNKTPEWKKDVIRRHIESFPTMESHYCRAKTARHYLDSKLSFKKMYEDFGPFFEKNLPPANETGDVRKPTEKVYRDIFCSEYNLSFYVPRKDQCAVCAKRNAIQGDTEKMQAYEDHILQKDRAQAEKNMDKARSLSEESFLMLTFDMQSILQLPVSEIGPLYYKRKLTLHNFTIYESSTAKQQNAFCFLWNETHGNRGANEIGTCIFTYLKSLDPKIKHVTFFSDCCSGQNRNRYVCAILMNAVNVLQLDVIDHKFLIPGHTMMECNSMHSAIERAQRHLALYSMREWVTVLKAARRHNPYSVKLMEVTDFLNLKLLASKMVTNRHKSDSGNVVNWHDIRCIRVRKDSPSKLFFKTDFDEQNFECVSQSSSQKWPKVTLTNAYSKRLRISDAKYADLVAMLKDGDIPAEYSFFYTSLPHSGKVGNLTPEGSDNE